MSTSTVSQTRSRPAINVGSFVGAGGVRSFVVGDGQHTATPAELDAMKKLVADAMEQGALGLSTSLQYVPSRYASTDELVALATVAAQYGGIYITHQRSESAQIDASLDEVFTIAERAHIPAEIWHLKTAYKANWGRMPQVLKRIAEARARGLDVTADAYPYDRASNGLDACLPLWVREGGTDPMISRLKDPSQRERIRREMDDPNVKEWENQWYGSGGAAGVMLSAVVEPSLKQYEGMTLDKVAAAMKKDPRDAVMDIVIADSRTERRDHRDHGSRRCSGGTRRSAHGNRHRLRGPGGGRTDVRHQVPSARVGVVSTDSRSICSRGTPAHARGGHPAVHIARGLTGRHDGSRNPPARDESRHHAVRSGHRAGRGDVRRSGTLFGGHQVRAGERAAGCGFWQNHRRKAR